MHKFSIMLVDDNPTFKRIIEQFFASHPQIVEMDWAQNGMEAIDLARTKQPDVVLLDLGMPDMSGLEVLPLLRSILPAAVIIVVTLLDADTYRRAALQAGANGFVAKSRLNAELIATIQEHISFTDDVEEVA